MALAGQTLIVVIDAETYLETSSFVFLSSLPPIWWERTTSTTQYALWSEPEGHENGRLKISNAILMRKSFPVAVHVIRMVVFLDCFSVPVEMLGNLIVIALSSGGETAKVWAICAA